MSKRWYIYVLAMALAITGFAMMSRPQVALAAGPDEGNVSVYVYHDVNRNGIWNWGEVAPPNMRGDHAWQWNYPCTHPDTVCKPAEIALVGAHVGLKYYGGETRAAQTFHDGPAQFAVPVGTQVVDVAFLGTGDGRKWVVTKRSQKTVNEPADSQFAFSFPLPPTGPESTTVILIGVTRAPKPDPKACESCGASKSAPTKYVIKSGDTLWGIAKAFGTTVEALASANGIANPDLIYAGATLTIP